MRTSIDGLNGVHDLPGKGAQALYIQFSAGVQVVLRLARGWSLKDTVTISQGRETLGASAYSSSPAFSSELMKPLIFSTARSTSSARSPFFTALSRCRR
jgi:hypothetical protein